MNMGSFRGTQYFLKYIQLGPNQLGVECVEHDVHGSAPGREELHESLFTADELEQCHAFFTLIETKYKQVRDAKEAELGINPSEVIARDRVHAMIKQADDAKAAVEAAQLETARIEAENIVKRAEVEELKRNLAVLQAAAAAAPVPTNGG